MPGKCVGIKLSLASNVNMYDPSQILIVGYRYTPGTVDPNQKLGQCLLSDYPMSGIKASKRKLFPGKFEYIIQAYAHKDGEFKLLSPKRFLSVMEIPSGECEELPEAPLFLKTHLTKREIGIIAGAAAGGLALAGAAGAAWSNRGWLNQQYRQKYGMNPVTGQRQQTKKTGLAGLWQSGRDWVRGGPEGGAIYADTRRPVQERVYGIERDDLVSEAAKKRDRELTKQQITREKKELPWYKGLPRGREAEIARENKRATLDQLIDQEHPEPGIGQKIKNWFRRSGR
jgi:hypothetical protein